MTTFGIAPHAELTQLCKDCAHFVATPPDGSAFVYGCSGFVDVVTGAPILLDCYEERGPRGRCGIGAQFFATGTPEPSPAPRV